MSKETETSKKNDEWRRATPIGLRRYAQEYLKVATDALTAHRSRLPENRRHHTHVPFPLYYNFLHSVELSLKAYLVHTGSGLKELRGVGHNLEHAVDLCIERGLLEGDESITDVMQEVIRHANVMYSNKDFEYIRVGATQLAHIDQIALAAEALLARMMGIDMQPGRPR